LIVHGRRRSGCGGVRRWLRDGIAEHRVQRRDRSEALGIGRCRGRHASLRHGLAWIGEIALELCQQHIDIATRASERWCRRATMRRSNGRRCSGVVGVSVRQLVAWFCELMIDIIEQRIDIRCRWWWTIAHGNDDNDDDDDDG